MDPIRVVIADDHAVVRAGLRLVLDAEEGLNVVAEAGEIDYALRMVRAHRPDVLVLDLNMPGGDSLPAIPELAGQTAVVVLTMQNDPAFARRAFQGGAKGYVLKEAADAELVQAVQAAAEGRTYLNPQLGARMAAAPPAPAGPPDGLTEREVGILRLIALGHTNAEIGKQLYLSVRTIESHRAHIQQKTGPQLARRAGPLRARPLADRRRAELSDEDFGMTVFRRAFVGFDGSAPAYDALALAQRLIEHAEGELLLACVDAGRGFRLPHGRARHDDGDVLAAAPDPRRWEQGVPLADLIDVVNYWRTGYNWRAFEERLNQIGQFRTTIDDLGIHFLHRRSARADATPLILTHGWPDSIVRSSM